MRLLAALLLVLSLSAGVSAGQLSLFAPTGSIVVDGNSLTQYVGDVGDWPNCLTPCSNAFGDWIYASLAFFALNQQGPTIYNVGVPGQTTQQLAQTASTRVDSHYNSAAANNILVFWEVSNELIAGTAPEVALEHLRDYVVARKAVGWKVVILTVIPRYADTYAFEWSRLGTNTQMRARWNQDLGADLLVDVAHESSFLIDGATVGPMYISDQTHLSMAGSRFVGKIVADALVTSHMLR